MRLRHRCFQTVWRLPLVADALLGSGPMWNCRRMPGRLALPLVAMAAAWALLPSAIGAQPRESGAVTTLAGNATVSRAGVSRHLRFRDSLFNGDTITTGEKSTLRVLLACKAIVTAHELTEWTIADTSGISGLGLTEGKLGLSIARQLMPQHDVLQVSTPNALATVRGSSVVVEVHGARSRAGIASVFSVLSGPVEVAAGGPTVLVGSLQRLRVNGKAAGLLEDLTHAEIEILTADLKGGARQHSAATTEFTRMLTARARDRALGHVSGQSGGSTGEPPSAPRRDEVLVPPRVSDVRHDNDTAATPDRCTAQAVGASGIVRESDTKKSAP